MILETTSLLIGLSGTSIPAWFYFNERSSKKRLELEYNIRVAQSLGHAASLRDHETGAHNYRVAYMASLFGESIALDSKTLQGLMKGAFLHDVGKIGIPDSILLKNGPLSKEEWETMKLHPTLGKQLLSQMPWFIDAIPVVLHHHEKYDGSGYPDGLSGDSIPLNARIFAIIDVFDALLSLRPYKKALSLDRAIEILQQKASSHFDPELVEKFILHAPQYALDITDKSENELKAMLESRRKKIFGI